MTQDNFDSTRDYTVAETGGILRVSNPTIYSLLANKRLESYKVGRARRITGASIAKLRNGKA
jgi:excisionase family DNA binding protein